MQYFLKVVINDSESLALEEAIKIYKKFITDKIGDKIEAPYWARLQAINGFEQKIFKAQSEIGEGKQTNNW